MIFDYLLAWAGIDVLVLQKDQEFLGDAHGNRISPSTPSVMDELGQLKELFG